MNSSTVSTFLVISCVVAVVIGANYQVFTKQELIDKFPLHDVNFQAHGAVNLKFREDCNTSMIPPDNGAGDYGDLIYKKESENSDKLLLREIFVNENVTSDEQIVFWSKKFQSKCVTNVKALNFGRDRAFAKSIYVNFTEYNGDTVDINVLIPVRKQVRMFIEVFGYEMYAPKYCDY